MKERGTVLIAYIGTLLAMLTLFFVVTQLGLAQTRALLNQLIAIQMTHLGYQNIKSNNPGSVFGPMTLVADLYGGYTGSSLAVTLPQAGQQTLPNGISITISKQDTKPGSCEAIVTSDETLLSGLLNTLFPIDTGAKSRAIGNATYLSLLFDMSQSLVQDYSIIQQLAAAGINWKRDQLDPSTFPTTEQQKRLPFAYMGYLPLQPSPSPTYPSGYNSALAIEWNNLLGEDVPARPWMYPWEYGDTSWPTPTPPVGCVSEIACNYNIQVGQAAHLWNLESDNFKAIKLADQYTLIALAPIFDKVDISTISAATAWGNVRRVGDTTNVTAIRGATSIFKHEWGDVLEDGVLPYSVKSTMVPNYSLPGNPAQIQWTNIWTNQQEYAWMQQAPLWDKNTPEGQAFWAPTDQAGTVGIPSIKDLYTPLWHERCAAWNPDYGVLPTPGPGGHSWTSEIQPASQLLAKPFWVNRYPPSLFTADYNNSDIETKAICMLAALRVQLGGTDTAAGLKHSTARCSQLMAGYTHTPPGGGVQVEPPTLYQCVTVLITDGMPQSGQVALPNDPTATWEWSDFGYESYSTTFAEQMAEINQTLDSYHDLRGLVFTLYTEPPRPLTPQEVIERQEFLDKMNSPDDGRYLIAIKTSPPVDLATTMANEQIVLDAVRALVALVLRIPKIVMTELD